MGSSIIESMRPRQLFAVLLIGLLTAALAPIAERDAGAQTSQIDDEAPGLAPAIALWAGAPRGHFTNIEAGVGSLSVDAIIADPDSAQAVSYEILVDGAVVDSGTTPRPSEIGRPVRISASPSASEGIHEVCLRLADRSNPGRTVNCRTATTIPADRAESSLEATAQGVVVSPSGVVVPVVGGTTNNWRVTTPCGATVTLNSGTFVDRARVVIDPGHGGSESGAVGGGIQEKNLNLVISDLVIDKFEALGISAQITRTGDYRVPILTRAEIAGALAADVFISVHHNGGAVRRSSVPGTEIFYSEVRPESQRLAAVLYEDLHAAAAQFDADWVSTINQGASVRLNNSGTDLFGIHRFSPEIDSVITEFAYLSNPSEAAILGRADVQEAQAQAIVDGVLRFWFSDDAGTSLGRRFTDPTSGGTGGFDSCVDPSLTSGTVGTIGLSNLGDDATNDTVNSFSTAPANAGPSLLPQLSLGSDPAIAVAAG